MVYASKGGRAEDPFLEELVDARNARGWTQERLADELGLSRSFVAMVEIGDKKPSVETARLWASKLGMNPRRFEAWVQSQRYGDMQEALTGMAEHAYWRTDPNVTVRVAEPDQIRFESGQSPLSKGADAERVPLIPEGADPDSEPPVLDYVSVQRELLKEERLVRPFAYRLSAEGVARVFKTLHAGDYAIISREARPPEKSEIYAVKAHKRIVLSRVMEKGPGLLLLMSDQGQGEIDVISSEDGKTRSLIVGKVAAAIRPLQYTVVKPAGRKSE